METKSSWTFLKFSKKDFEWMFFFIKITIKIKRILKFMIMEYKQLIEEAIKMLSFSYSPYSHFRVGASLLCQAENGSEKRIFNGCNIENAAFGPSICAERTAVFKAVSEGFHKFEAICIVGGAEDENKNVELKEYCPPCGVCRQVLSEFCSKDFKIILAKSTADYKIFTLGELLPESFSLSNNH